MLDILLRNIFRFLVLILIQALILNNIHLFGMNIYPFIYLLFIILLPFETPKWLLLVSAFLLGITLDIFLNTFGLHATASVFAAYIRPAVLQLISPRYGYEIGTLPRISYYGRNWIIKYSLMLIIPHHLIFFILEKFDFQNFHITLANVLGSALFTLILIIISQYLFYRK